MSPNNCDPLTGICTITITSALPAIGVQVTVDGSTQPGHPCIVVNGSSAGAGVDGLTLGSGSDNSTVQSLVINSFGGYGVVLQSTGNTIQGNLIGTDVTGTSALANVFGGIVLETGAANNTIGGAPSITGQCNGACNLISGNSGDGIDVFLFNGEAGNAVYGNFIGPDKTGLVALGNAFDGIFISAGVLTVGSNAAGTGNVISGNLGNGIELCVGGCSPHCSLGIDLADDGVTPNQTPTPGPNNFQNFPVLTSAATPPTPVPTETQTTEPTGTQTPEATATTTPLYGISFSFLDPMFSPVSITLLREHAPAVLTIGAPLFGGRGAAPSPAAISLRLDALLLILALMFSVGLIGVMDDLGKLIYDRLSGGTSTIRVHGANFVFAVISVALSRLLTLTPGMVFGNPGGLEGDVRANPERASFVAIGAVGATFRRS